MQTVAEIAQGLIVGLVYMIVYYNGPAQQNRALTRWERTRPGSRLARWHIYSWTHAMVGSFVVMWPVVVIGKLIFHW